MDIAQFKNEPFTDFSRPEHKSAFEAALKQVAAGFGRTWSAWIAGEEITGREPLESRDPGATDRVVGVCQKLTPQDGVRAVEKAHEAFPAWADTPVEERTAIFRRAAALMRERKHLFSASMVYEVGKSWPEADADTAECIDFLEYYALLAERMARPQPVSSVAGEKNQMIYIPLGVAVVIPPWNFPLAIMAGMTSAALLAGNTVVLKPASQSPVIAARFVELLHEAGLPKNVLNFVTGPGSSVGNAMVEHQKTRLICFTGSREVGLHIFAKSAQTPPGQIWMKRLIAEMGGKDGILVDGDCDLDAAVTNVAASAFGYQGQKCSACSRAMIHRDVYDQFIERLVPVVEAITQGHPENPAFFMGPLVDAAAERKTLEYIEIGKREGRLLVGGAKAEGNGYYIQPTLFADIKPQARLAKEEIFGPVLALIRVTDFAHGLEVANNTDYGLTGSLYTNNEQHKEEAKRRFHVGNFYINRKCTGALVGGHPFGGFNMSGTDSKAGGPDYLLQFTQAKTISEKIS